MIDSFLASLPPCRLVALSWRLVLSPLLLLAALPPCRLAAQSTSLQKRVDARLDAPPFNRQLWGVALVDEKGTLLYGRNADRMFVPASNTKIVVSAVAAALFAPDFTVRTSAYGSGPVVNGALQGDLVLYGRGDPTFSERCYAVDTTAAGACDASAMLKLTELATQLARAGITSVSGDVVGDGSWFEPTLVHPAWENYDINWWFAAPVSGLGFNDNSIDIEYSTTDTAGPPAMLAFAPDFGDVTLDNRTRTVPRGQEETIDFFRTAGTLSVWAQGSVEAGRRVRTEYFALPDPNLFTARALRAALAAQGIAVLGSTRSTTDSMAYEIVRRGMPLAEVTSRPLKDWIFPILNTSQNWYAEMTLKQLGKQFGRAGSWDEGLRIERRFLIDSVGVDSTQIALSDGSGLSASNLVSPLAFTKILRFIRSHPRYATFAAGLPQSGQRGTLKNRFVGTPIEGKVRAKTGSISRTNTLSGFVELESGKVMTFSIQANHHALSGSVILAQLDSVVVEMAKGR
jgi:D-alanyl-D-alanine carboxypeptidase/D-alanyl-D-alanine-endopeptidase (penicillin-binding protein 4)